MKFLLLALVLLCLCAPGYAQNWSGILAPARAIDWSLAGVPGGIPNRTTICQTIAPYNGTASTINTAIQNCPSGQVVKLAAGTFSLSTGIDFNGKSNVTLRGSGPTQTILNISNEASCTGYGGSICVRGSAAIWPPGGVGTVYNFTGSGPWPKGTTQVTLNSVSGLAVGMILFFDQLNDFPDKLSTTPGVLVCDTVNVCSLEGSNGTRANRNQVQAVEITSINGSTVTFTPGLYLPNWRASQSPQAWKWGTLAQTAILDGVEDLTLNNTGGSGGNITFTTAAKCWVKNVKSTNTGRSHVWLYVAHHIEVRDSYFYGTQLGGITSYGVETYSAGGDHLIINNIFQHIPSPLVIQTTAGTVVAYNFTLDPATPGDWMWQAYTGHNSGVGAILFEGNVGNSFRLDTFHGTADFVTAFRNYWDGTEPGKTSNTIPFNAMAGGRYTNAIGNVLGTNGTHSVYERTTQGSNCNNAVYVNGFTGACTEAPFDTRDPFVDSTLMRWGNYDAATDTARFLASEVPSGLSDYPNPVPANQTLPASFFLPAKPSWWGSVPWPAIGPEVTGGPGLAGHAYGIPAELCYNNTPKDGSGILMFDAAQCYGSAGAPPEPPVNLTVIVR